MIRQTQVRVAVDAGHTWTITGGGTFRPSLELALRHDGGDADTGAGVEVGAGLDWRHPASGFGLEARARVLAAHGDSDAEEWGASATARLDPGAHGRGLSFSVSPTFGAPASTTAQLWDGARPAASGVDRATGLRAELGYGVGVFGGRFTATPHAGVATSSGVSEYRLGWRLAPATRAGFELGVDALRRDMAGSGLDHAVRLAGRLFW